jgi:hypothetical protein
MNLLLPKQPLKLERFKGHFSVKNGDYDSGIINSSLFNEFVRKLGLFLQQWDILKRE